MNYQSIEHEIKEYSTYFKYCDSVTSKFSIFFKEFTKSGSKFIIKSKKLIDDIYSEINKEEYFSSTLNKNINNFCEELKESLDKMQTFFSRIETDIIDKINEFDKDYKIKSKNYLNKLNDLNLYLTDNKSKLEKTKNIYFDSCKNTSDFEKKYLTNKQNMKEEEYNKLKEQYEKLKQASETKKVNYRIEVTKLNDLLVSNENYYLEIINSISKQEEEKCQFYVKIILLFNNGIKEFNIENKESIARNEKYIDEIYIKRDLKLFTIYFNRINNKEKNRFFYEEFLDYENVNINQNKNISGENKNSQNNDTNNNINDNDVKDIEKIDLKLATQIIELGQEPFIDIDTMDNEFIELDNIIFNLIQRDEKIDDEKFLRIVNFVDGNTEGCKNFIYLLMGHYCLKNLVKFNNIENIYLLCTILNMIINYIWDNEDYSYISFLILLIGEKTVYYSSADKHPTHYLCKIMSKNTIYHMNEFWSKIINLKIKMLAKIKLNEEFHLRRKNSISKKDGGLISKFFGGNENNEKIERDILYSQIYKDKASFYCSEILCEYIIHFMNYDFMNKSSTVLIEQLSSQYDLNSKQKNYFLEMVNSNIIYIKSFNPYFSDFKSDIIEYENQEDLDKLYFSFNSNKKFKFTKNNSKMKILLFSLKYLNNNDIIPILCLNRECNNKLKKIVYKNILLKYNNKIDIKKHIGIWKIILNYNLIKKKYNYKSILETINKDKNKDSIFDVIELDTIRTSFSNNQELNQSKLKNILKAASKELPTVNYCQGMNHIAAFLLILCNEDEEETFYLFLSILFATDYCGLIVNDLLKLNSFFYCFERLLNIMYPEMNSYFKNINVDGGYFLSPWFITLFTNAFNDAKGKENFKIMLKIFDLFLLSGWKAIFKIGLALIRYNSIKIFSLPYEQLIHYLNNEIMNSDFFKDENYNELINISINFKISNNLINNLCKEYEMKRSIMNKNK